MTYTILAAVPAALLAAMYIYETRANPTPLRARAAKSTLDNALRGRR